MICVGPRGNLPAAAGASGVRHNRRRRPHAAQAGRSHSSGGRHEHRRRHHAGCSGAGEGTISGITGPGLAHAIVVSGNGEPGQPGMLTTLALQTRLFSVTFGPNAPVPPSCAPRRRRPPSARDTRSSTPSQASSPCQANSSGRSARTSTLVRPAGRLSIRHHANPGPRADLRMVPGQPPPAPHPCQARRATATGHTNRPPDPSPSCRTPGGSAANELTNPCLAHRIRRSHCGRSPRRHLAVAASSQALHRPGQRLTNLIGGDPTD